MTPTGWYERMLDKRNLDTPDGRSLYQYRVKESEYALLQAVLSDNPDHYEEWDACFVMYASEWWRRNYTEGHWTWDPIFSSIRKWAPQPNHRNQIVAGGLENWGRKVYKDGNGHHDYLATVIVECGIPIQVLNRERGWLNRLIYEAYNDLSLITLSEFDAPDIVKHIAEQINLPVSLHKPGFYDLIAQIAHEAINLKREFNLGKEESPTGHLDQVKPDWRQSFPVQIDVEAGKQFLDELLTEVAKIPDPKNYGIALIKELLQIDGHWRVKTTLDLPNEFYSEEDLRLEKNTLDAFPSRLNIELINSSEIVRQVGIAYKTVKGNRLGLQFSRLQANFGFEAHAEDWKLRLNQPEKSFSVQLPLPGGDALDDESPWVFVENNGKWELKAVASYRTRMSTALVVFNSEWNNTGDLSLNGRFDAKRNIYIVRGKGEFSSADQNYQVVTNSSIEENFSYYLHGLTLDSSLNGRSEVYLGFPSLYKINNATLRKSKVYKKLEVKKLGQYSWQQSSDDQIGSLQLRLIGDNSEVLFSKRISVLPHDFAVSFESVDPIKGKICLKKSAPFVLSLSGKKIGGSIERLGDGHIIEVESLEAVPTKSISVSLMDKWNSEITLDLPFPSSGVKFFNKKGLQLKNGSKLYLDDLHGSRLMLFNPTAKRKSFNVVFELSAKDTPNIRLFKVLQVESYHLEVPLISFKGVLNRLFAVAGNLDASVNISVEHGFSVRVKRYSATAHIDFEEGIVAIEGEQENLLATTIQAFRFDEELEGQTVINLLPLSNEENISGQWRFAEGDIKPGKWLIYPSENSAITFRPRLWIIPNEETFSSASAEIEEISQIKEAACFTDGTIRLAMLIRLASKMADDFSNQNWKEVNWLWENTNHLPLNTFDVWTVFTKSEEALISLFFSQDNSLIDRISEEFPILWEIIPVQKWIKGARKFYSHWIGVLPEYANELVDNKLQYLESQHGLCCLSQILRSEVLGSNIKEFENGINSQFISYHINHLLNGGPGYLGLKNRKADDWWPEFLIEEIAAAYRKLPEDVKKLFPPTPVRRRQSVIYLPALLAASTVEAESFNLSSDIKDIYQVREIQNFDKEWFNVIYDIIQGYYWMSKKNTISYAE